MLGVRWVELLVLFPGLGLSRFNVLQAIVGVESQFPVVFGRVAELSDQLKDLASGQFAAQPALASLLVRWSSKLKTELDGSMLVGHFERLALTASVVAALRRAAERLPKGSR